MKTIARCIFVGWICVAAADLASGGIPPINVKVLDSSGKTAFKGPTNGGGVCAAGTLKPGGYVVQFNSTSAPKTSRYMLIASAGKEKVVANGIPGEKFVAGVAVTIQIPPGSSLMVQVTAEDKNSAPIGHNGKLMVWIPKQTGSNIAPHWAESDSAEAKIVQTSSSYSSKNILNKQNQGVSPLNDTAGKMTGH